MFNQEIIRNIEREAEEKKWPYAYLFNSLKSIGIDRYETNVLTHEITYVGEGHSLKVPPPEGFAPLTASPTFDLAALKAALERVQKRETNYLQFLSEIAAAGVSFYRVDMRPRTVTYHGPGKKNKLVEKVPNT